MGYILLSAYRTDVQEALGNKAIPDATLDRYINLGYFDVVGSVNAEILNSESAIPTVVGQEYIPAPTNVKTIHHIRYSDRTLAWTPWARLFREPMTPTGVPTRWYHFGNRIYLRPVPAGIYSLVTFIQKSAAKLTNVGDVSILPDEFDGPILSLAISWGFLFQNEERRAAYWMQLAIESLKAKIVPQDIDGNDLAPGTPGYETLKNRLKLMQNAAANQA